MNKPKTLREQIARRCVHFTGLMQTKCEAGCVYELFDLGAKVPYRRNLPCFKLDADEERELRDAGIEQAKCDRAQFPTEKELDEHDRVADERAAKIKTVATALVPIRKEHAGKNWSGTIECPACKGVLHVYHVGFNGHMHVACETDGCVQWME